MEQNNLSHDLYVAALSMGACGKVMNEWNDKYLNKEELICLWLKNADFAIKKDFPSISYITKNADKELLKKHNVFLDTSVEKQRIGERTMIMGSSNGIFIADTFDFGYIFVRHNSDITIQAKGFSKILVEVYDNSIVNIVQEKNAKVFVYNYSKNSTITYEGDIIIRDKTK